MSKYAEVMIIVEGKTEEIFVNTLLKPYLAPKNVFLYATQVTKPGQKGGDVRFDRVKKDLELHLKQRPDTYVTTFVDYYGVKDWPGLDLVPRQAPPQKIAEILADETQEEVSRFFAELRVDRRFIPYMAIHEFEALLFSDSAVLAAELGIAKQEVDDVLKECGEPEAINNSPENAPSKRLDNWSDREDFPKTTAGISIAKKIGVDAMRSKCPLFSNWISCLESLAEEPSNLWQGTLKSVQRK